MKAVKRIGMALVMALVLLSWNGIAWAGEIHDAAKAGDVVKVKALLAGNPGLVNARNQYGMTPLHEAAMNNSKDIAELLLANKADVNARDDFGNTPLHQAAQVNSKSIVNGSAKDVAEFLLANKNTTELLLANKADVNAKNNAGWTSLRYAVVKNNKDVAGLLRQHGGVE